MNPVATTDSTDVILRDGSTLRLRAPATEDAAALLEFFSGLSEHSRYLRFHGFPALGPSAPSAGGQENDARASNGQAYKGTKKVDAPAGI